jgi:hypothetical protein
LFDPNVFRRWPTHKRRCSGSSAGYLKVNLPSEITMPLGL